MTRPRYASAAGAADCARRPSARSSLPGALLEPPQAAREPERLTAGILLLLLELAESLLHLGDRRCRQATVDGVLQLVELTFLLTDEALSGGNRLASPGQLVARAQKELLGVSELFQSGLDLSEPVGVGLGR